MINKISKLILGGRIFLVRASVIVLFLVIILIEAVISGSQGRKYTVVNQEAALVKEIPEMEKRLVKPQAAAPVIIVKDAYVLQGTNIESTGSFAIISGGIYKEGAMVGDYKVIKIDRKSVILENPSTMEQKNLSL